MIETTKEICRMCGKEYEDTHIAPRAFFAPYWCEECTEVANAASGGSWIAAAWAASNRNPYEEE